MRTDTAARAKELWEFFAGAETGFAPVINVAVSSRSYLGPPGWVGIVVIGDTALATAPDHETARLVEQALKGLPVVSVTDTGALSGRLPVGESLGPAALAYLDPPDFRRLDGRRPRDRGRQSAAMAGTTRGVAAYRPRPGLPRTRLPGELPPRPLTSWAGRAEIGWPTAMGPAYAPFHGGP